MKVITAVTNPGTTVAMRDIVPADPVTGLPADPSRAQEPQTRIRERAAKDDAEEAEAAE